MLMKLTKYIGQPICIALYIFGIVMAIKKKFVPLIALFTLHLSEYFIIGKKTAKEHNLSVIKGIIYCLSFGFTWWLPLRKNK